MIRLFRTCEPRLFDSIRVPADELIKQWEIHLRDVIFLAYGEKPMTICKTKLSHFSINLSAENRMASNEVSSHLRIKLIIWPPTKINSIKSAKNFLLDAFFLNTISAKLCLAIYQPPTLGDRVSASKVVLTPQKHATMLIR